jgi:hypothetical protein
MEVTISCHQWKDMPSFLQTFGDVLPLFLGQDILLCHQLGSHLIVAAIYSPQDDNGL